MKIKHLTYIAGHWITFPLCCLCLYLGILDGLAVSVGDRVEANGTVNVRSTPAGTPASGQQSSGSLGVVIGGPQTATLSGTSYTWYDVDFDTGVDGWVADSGSSIGLTVVAPTAPTQIAPGNGSSPGLQISTLTPTISWNAALGANGYGVYVEDVATSALVYNNDSVGNVTSVTLPSGTLVAGHNYVWNMRSSDSAEYTYCTSHYYFYTQAAAQPPSITSVSPNPAAGSNSGQTLNVYGSGFVSGAQVNLAWPTVGNIPAGNKTLTATFVSSSQLQVTATLGNDPETWTAQVINPGNVTSSTFNFSEQAPFPVITSLSPSSATAGGSSFTLTVNGTTFDQSSVIYWNGTALTTSHTISVGLTTAISATIPVSDIASSGSATVTVYTPSPGGGTSSGATFSIGGGTPTISNVSPNPATGSNSGQTLNVYGSGFVSGAQVNLAWPTVGNIPAGNKTLSATFVSSSELQVTATLGNDPETWTAQVINPGNVTSSTFNFSEQAPFPVITSLSPSSATAGGSSFTLTVNGTTFDQSSVIYWNGTALTTSHTVSVGLTTAIYATVPASDIASSGSATVTVYTPSPGGGTSSGVTFPFPGGSPTISSVSPNPATGSNSGQMLTINGSGFVSGAQVNLAWPTVGVVTAGNATKSATFVSSSELQVTATLGNDPETWTAQVINPGNVTSSTFNFNEQAPFPVITSLSPSSATAGGSSFTLTVNGTTFDQSSVIYWNGAALTTSHTVSGGLTTAISATVPASDIASAGSATVTVYTPSPGGGTSSAMSFTIGSGGGGGSQILGIDVSTAINWPAATGIQFAYLKATESSSAYYPNPNFTANVSGAIGQHIAVGAYHFATPLFSPGFYQAGYDHQDTAQDEALNFVATAQNVIGSGFLPPALDVEEQVVSWEADGITPSAWADPLTIMGAPALAQWIEDWVSDEEQLTHIVPIVYCDRTYATALSPYLNGTVQLWIADWTNPAGSPASPTGWPWLFDQYSSTGSIAGKSPIDLDIFNGDSTAFNALLNATSGDTTPPTVAITLPTSSSTYSTSSSTVNLSGTASDNVGVVDVIWSDTQTGGAGTTSGTTSWSANNISLANGDNTITVTAYDAAGNHSTATLTVTYTPTANGLTIIPIWDSSITSDPQAATIEATINSAIAAYQNNFSDPVTVSIKFQEVTTGLGASSKPFIIVPYSAYIAALVSHATTVDDTIAIAHLPNTTSNPVNGNQNIDINYALARALGFSADIPSVQPKTLSGFKISVVNPSASDTVLSKDSILVTLSHNLNQSLTNSTGSGLHPLTLQPDGTILLNTTIMNLSAAQTDPTKYSLFSVVSHEIDEVLGFGSALNGLNNGDAAPTGPIMPEDLFRYAQNGTRNFTTDVNAASYFSLDGTTDIARFNQQQGGDFGDWYSYFGGQIPQVQDAYSTPGAAPVLGVELRCLDVIGFTLVSSPDTQGPTLAITSPANGDIVTSASLSVNGMATDNGNGNNGVSSVMVNGTSATGGTTSGSGTANWSATVTLLSGVNTITVVAKDTLNNSITKTVNVTYNPSRPIFGSSSVSGGQLQTTLSGLSVGETVGLYSSTDLKNWTLVQTKVATGSTVTFTPGMNPAMKGQYFRVQVQ